MKKFIFILAFLLSGCNILIKDEPKTGINFIPIEFNVESINYIKEYQSNETTWKMKPSGDIDVILEIIFPLTDRIDINVVDLKQNQNDIMITLDSKYKKNEILKKPIIKIKLKGINPYKKLDYNLIVKSNFNFFKTNLNSNMAKEIVIKNNKNINYNPTNLYISKYGNKKHWILEYPIVLNEKENTISKMTFTIDDSTKEIIQSYETPNSIIIGNGEFIDIFDDFILYKNLNSLYAYSIPKNESIKIFDINTNIDIAKKDKIKNKIYFFSHFQPNKLYKLNSNLSIKEIIFDFKILNFTVNNDIIYLTSKNNDITSIYKYDKNIIEIKKINNEIKNIDSNGKDIVVEINNNGKSSIHRIHKNKTTVFIGYGKSPIIDENYLYYIKDKEGLSNSFLINYSLNTGLSNSHICGIIKNLIFDKNKIIVKENVEGIIKLSTFQNNILNEIIQFTNDIHFISKYNSIIHIYKNNIYLSRISN